MVSTSRWREFGLLALASLLLAGIANNAFAGFVWSNPDSVGWWNYPSPTYPYSKSMNLKDDSGALDMTMTVVSGTNMKGHVTYTDAAFEPMWNPPPVAGSVIHRFWPDNDETAGQPRTTLYRADFSVPLQSGDIILMSDFDDDEEALITAYDLADQPINMSSWTTLITTGHEYSTYDSPPVWTPNYSGFTARLKQTGGVGWSTEPLFLIYVGSPVKRLEFEFYLPEFGDIDFAIGAYQVEVSLIPEPASLVLCGIGVAGGLVLLRRRRG